MDILDLGPSPLVIAIDRLARENTNYRATLWTGTQFQVTLMSITPGADIGLEQHLTHDQLLCIVQGIARVRMGHDLEELREWHAAAGDIVIVPAGAWHDLVNTGVEPLRLYSLYAPPQHAHGTVHATRDVALAAEAPEAV